MDRRTLLLASGSPRRRRLLEQLGIPLEVAPPRVDERERPGEAPRDYVLRLSREKGEEVAKARPDRILLAADTAVVVEGARIFGKPADAGQARSMLRELSGREHEVVTGVFASGPGGARSVAVSTRVRFKAIGAGEIDWYVASGEPMDKAGAYAIQDRGGAFVASIEGSHSNVVGLPLCESLALLAEVGLELPWDAAGTGGGGAR